MSGTIEVATSLSAGTLVCITYRSFNGEADTAACGAGGEV